MSEEIWEKVWAKNLVISDYSLKYLDFINTLKTDLQHDSKILEAGCGTRQTLALFSDDQFTSGLDISVAASDELRRTVQMLCLEAFFRYHLTMMPLISFITPG